MSKRTHRILSAAVSLLLFAVALWAIQKSLGSHSPREIIRSIAELPVDRLGLALLFTAVNYLFVAGVDTLASRYAGRPLPYVRMLIPSFIGATFQYNAGVFGGTAVRFRLYSSLGFSVREIGRVMLLIFLTFSIGSLTLTGLALLLDPLSLPGTARFPWWPEIAGALLLCGAAAYFWLCARGKPVWISRWHFLLPRLRASLLQVFLAACDWIVGAAILYVLLPDEGRGSFFLFVAVFMLAHNIGIASNTPGGLGVFEATVLHLHPTSAAPTDILAALLAYRGMYYVLPLLLATILLGRRELAIRRAGREKRVLSSQWEVVAEGMESAPK